MARHAPQRARPSPCRTDHGRPGLPLLGSDGELSRPTEYGPSLAALAKQAYATMRVEKTGEGDSEGPACTDTKATADLEAKGYVAGLRALKSYEFVDPARVFVFAHSLGPLVGAMVLPQESVRGFIAAETIGRSWFEYGLENVRRRSALAGEPLDQVDADVRAHAECSYHFFVQHESGAEVSKLGEQCKEMIRSYAGVPDTFMHQIGDISLAKQWKQVDTPVLVIYGTSDPRHERRRKPLPRNPHQQLPSEPRVLLGKSRTVGLIVRPLHLRGGIPQSQSRQFPASLRRRNRHRRPEVAGRQLSSELSDPVAPPGACTEPAECVSPSLFPEVLLVLRLEKVMSVVCRHLRWCLIMEMLRLRNAPRGARALSRRGGLAPLGPANPSGAGKARFARDGDPTKETAGKPLRIARMRGRRRAPKSEFRTAIHPVYLGNRVAQEV